MQIDSKLVSILGKFWLLFWRKQSHQFHQRPHFALSRAGGIYFDYTKHKSF